VMQRDNALLIGAKQRLAEATSLLSTAPTQRPRLAGVKRGRVRHSLLMVGMSDLLVLKAHA
jgi:hypothetical protein